MSSYFSDSTLGGDGNTYTDDSNATTGLGNGGFWTRLVPMFSSVIGIADYCKGRATAAAQSVLDAAAQVSIAAGYAATALAAPGTNATSATSLTIGLGSKTLTVQTGKNFVVGMSVKIANTSSPTSWMSGDITAYNSATGSLTVNVTTVNGSGSGVTTWTISLSGPAGSNGGINAAAVTSGSVNITLTTSSAGYQSVTMTALGKHVTLPDATSMAVGGPRFIIKNDGGYPFGIRDNAGGLVAAVAAGGIAHVSLRDNSTAAGVWTVIGDNLEPGLITIDQTFSSTYGSTILKPFVALDANKSIHFLQGASSGRYAVCVDNSTGAVGTPVACDPAGGVTIRTAFKVSATSIVVFYGDGTNCYANVISVTSGTTLSVGTAATVAGTDYFSAEDFLSAPKIAQLTSTLYLASYTSGTNTTVVAVSVSGTTVTVGSPVNIVTANSVANSTTTYALTATTALVLYKSGAGSPYNNCAVVISVSGTTCAVGTPVAPAGCTSATTSPPASVLLSPTKAIVVDDATTTQFNAVALTISGTAISAGAVATFGSMAVSGNLYYTSNGANRYVPHLWALSANSAALWAFDNSSISSAVVLTESGGVISNGTIAYKSISSVSSATAGYGLMLPQGASEFVAVNKTSFGLTLNASKISGTNITSGTSVDLDQKWSVSPSDFVTARLSSGIYVGRIETNGHLGGNNLEVFSSNGDFINHRGRIKTPTMAASNGGLYPQQVVSSNRLVILGTARLGTTLGTATYPIRLLNVEICQ